MRVRMKTYVGRLCKGIPLVYVIQVDGDSRMLRHKATYRQVHEWGVRGGGSLQLAYDILYDATGDLKLSYKLHHAFQRDYIVPLARSHVWKMSEVTVLKAAATLTTGRD